MRGNKIGLRCLFALMAVTFTANPLPAMEGRVDNLKVDGSCNSEQEAVVVNAFRAANLLVRFSWTAVNIRQMIAENKTIDINTQPNMVVDKYTGLNFDQDRIVDTYTKVFGPYNSEFWKIIDQKYATVTPFPSKVKAVCVSAQQQNCTAGAPAFVEGDEIVFCPVFFEMPLTEAKKFEVYKSASQIELYRAGLIVHEMMHLHFMNTRSSDDTHYMHDYENILALSKKNPIWAAENADSYHVFTMLAYGLGKAPKCVLPTDRWCNCGSGMQCR